ncbi:MAG: hypothetical protein EB027_07435 [Actinobacteria bacterium]|nr:hypothetical protein [Actinomycetota bacterium]
MISSITLSTATGNVTLHSTAAGSNAVVTRAEGLQGTPPVRNLVTQRSQASGGFVRSRFTDTRSVVLEGEVLGTSIENAFDNFDVIAAAMYDSISTERTLKWRRDSSGELLQAGVRLSDFQPLTLTDGAAWIKYQATFTCPDPRVYSQTLTTGTGAALSAAAGGKTYNYTYTRGYNPSSGGNVSYTNSGSVPTPPIIRIYGYCTSPQVVLTDDTRLIFTGEVGDGDYLEVDCANRTVKLNGSTSRLNLLDPVNSTFFALPVGTGTVQMVASNFNANARADLIYRPAFT